LSRGENMVASLFKKITDIDTFADYPNGSLEVACRAQIADYTVGTVNIQDMSYDTATSTMCAVGNYFSDGTATNTGGDTIATQAIPLVMVASAGVTTPATTTWILTALYDSVDITLQSPNTEQSGLVSVITLPAGKSTNWVNDQWLAVGHANTDLTQMQTPGTFQANVAPNSNMTPLFVSIRSTGAVEFESSVNVNSRPSWAWFDLPNATNTGINPMLLSDIVYCEENDQVVMCGSSASDGAVSSFGMMVESDLPGVQPYKFAVDYGNGSGVTRDGPSIIRTLALQDTDVGGTPSATNVLVLFGGGSNSNASPAGGTGIFGVYQPDFSNAWGAGQRWVTLANGNSVSSFWVDYIGGVKGGTASDYFNSVVSIKRVTTDGEDLYVIMGTSDDGPNLLISDAPIETGATGAPTVYDNTIPASGDTDIKFPEINWLGSELQANLPAGYNPDANKTAYTCVGLTNRKTKVISGGVIDDTAVFPVAGPAGTGFLISMSRGAVDYTAQVQNDGQLPQNTASFLKSYYIPNSDVDRFYILNSRINGLFFSSPTSGNLTNLSTVTPITNHKAEAYFEYLLYDGIDALIAKKLQQLGVRVTITNLEWYKQDVLKQGLDLDADFFREWATAQTEENQKRERLTEFYGPTRPQKRAVREPFFDDYANREEILNKMDKYREESPLDDVPYNDEVAEDREAKKLEKDLEDKIRIEKLVDEETSDKDKT